MLVVIPDLECGNLGSIKSALDFVGASYQVTQRAVEIENASHVILAGVGSFDTVMGSIEEFGFGPALVDFAAHRRRPLLGICVGMQVLSGGSSEGEHEGLGLVAGKCECLIPNPKLGWKVPHVGFDRISGYKPDGLFADMGPTADVYFTHSYALRAMAGKDRMNQAYFEHSGRFLAGFQLENVCGTQFHPEKSQSSGLKILCNFLQLH